MNPFKWLNFHSRFSPFIVSRKSNALILVFNPQLKRLVLILTDFLNKYLQAKQVDLLLYNKKERLISFINNDYHGAIYHLCQESIITKKSICINRVEELDKEIIGDTEDVHLELPVILVPIFIPEGCLGVLCVKEPLYAKTFINFDLQLIETFLSIFKITFRKGMLYQPSKGVFSPIQTSIILAKALFHCKYQLKKLEHRFSSITAVTTLIHSAQEINELIDSILHSARKVLQAQNASLFMRDKKTGEFYFQVISGKKDERLLGKRIPGEKGVVGICAREKQPIVVNDAIRDTRVYHEIGEGKTKFTRNLIASPLLVNEECIGVIEVINTINRPKFTEEDVFLFQAFSTSVAIAIHKRILLDNLKQTNDELQNELNKTKTLYAVSGTLLTITKKSDLFRKIITTVQENLNINYISVLLYDKKKKELRPETISGFPPEQIWQYLPQELALGLCEKEEDMLISDMNSSYEMQDFCKKQTKTAVGSGMFFFLKSIEKSSPQGLLCVVDAKKNRFTQGDFDLFTTIVSELERAYQSLILQEEFIQRRALEKEVEIASILQEDILPQAPLYHNYVDLYAKSIMAKTIGGDLYYHHSEDHNSPVTMLIGDVSGKSISAAFFMAMASSVLKTAIHSEFIPAKILSKANDFIHKESKRGMFVTLFLANYLPEKQQLHYASAGHNKMILIRRDGSHELLSGKGMPLGIASSFETNMFTDNKVNVFVGDMLVLYTDGITEAVNQENQEFGIERLISLLKEHKEDNLDKLLEFTFEEVTKFGGNPELYDDLSLLICRFKAPFFEEQKYEFQIEANQEAVLKFIKKSKNIFIKAGLSSNLIQDILLIMEEVSINIVRHAFKGIDDEKKEMHCFIKIEKGHKVYLTFKNKGKTFNLLKIKAPKIEDLRSGKVIGKLGMPIITSVADKIEYSYEEGFNVFMLEKKIKQPKKREGFTI